MIHKAVILAAGSGNRISAVARNVPKPLLPLSGEPGSSPTFLDWHVRALSAAGVKEIYLVGNPRTFGNEVEAAGGAKVTWILNPTEEGAPTGSGHSTWFAWQSKHNILDGKSRVVLMDADILYDPSIYGILDAHPSPKSKTLVCSDYRHTNEEVLVFAKSNALDMPLFHGKGLLERPLPAGTQCIGEATGILLWEPIDHEALSRATDWTIRFSTAKVRSEHEDITQCMMLAERVAAVGFSRDLSFMECDTPEEYAVLTSEMYPKLRGLLGYR